MLPNKQPNRSRTAHEYARERIRTAILSGELAAGTRLLQREIAADLDVSTTPVREALRDLATEGLIYLDAHRGAVVRSLDLDEVREIYEMRMALEPLMIKRVLAAFTDERLAVAADLCERMAAEPDLSVWVDLNRRFHGLLSDEGDDGKLAQTLRSLRASASAYVSLSLDARPEQVGEANAEHRRLVELYRARDLDGIVAVTLQHLRNTLAAIEAVHQEF
ncbi:GntR family transcriptional regulator [Nonomuraea sp. NPDC050394]|uniref:GntR family transcriptional regulator n=1 Tax=Nonomuraea sp. NPDC050394 TaxID=3364363 RepID=UPI0037B8D1EC